MTLTAVAYSANNSSSAAGIEMAKDLQEALNGAFPDALIVFASSSHDVETLLRNLQESCKPKVLVGCSSAGEFISGRHGESSVSAFAICSDEMEFQASYAEGLRANHKNAAVTLTAPFKKKAKKEEFVHRSMLLLTDALAGRMDDFIEEVTIATSGEYQLFGGGAGDDAKFSSTDVFLGTESKKDAVVALEILSKKPVGIGVRHGWQVVGDPARVTEASGMKLISVNSISAVEFIEDYAQRTQQDFDRKNPIPFFLHNTLGINEESGIKIRMPLAVEEDGSLICAADIPVGATLTMMNSSPERATEAAASAVASALKQIEGYTPKAALFFDCVATRLRLNNKFELELAAVQAVLGEQVSYAGCNTYGQVARVKGQFNGFHNCTAVVCVIAD